ncbi:response regulator [Anaeromyxobacter paludicola]|uniref:Response regulator n=1 Tax=Anaeromyxobacter paludicola TaxID=2918171 RepID=A0ABM7X821_9BACT|nr:response regulator [Anaeromyxobacter paludicola]BDG07983.1 response regulator [Anaeromyxobacter paludicola]
MSYSVLVVDDSSIVRAMVKKSLAMAGLDVKVIHEAGNGEEALAVLRREWVDIVFADLNMPVMGGLELVRHMAEDRLLETVPVVIVSSEHAEARIAELKQRGARAYIKKPFRPEQFREVLGALLGAGEGGSHG